ncbi:hypothetical protein TcCL_ESM06831 [Trypanosoma cruzi]|nr:hypothetical protein TcCL_ESM06831 [Trypanosoma cruzi]
MSVAFFLLGRFQFRRGGMNTARFRGLEELLPFFEKIIFGMIFVSYPCLPRFASLSGTAPWPSSCCLQEEGHIASDETTLHACGVQGGTYLRWSAHMWMSCETKRGLTAQP